MGHYASEMGYGLGGPSNEEIRSKKLAGLQDAWDWGQTLFSQGHQPSGKGYSYTCPRCFAEVNYWFLTEHTRWHNDLKYELGLGLIG